MSKENDTCMKKWNIMKEQLIALCALNKLQKGNEEFATFLKEDIQLKNLNSQLFTTLCYYILGIINYEEREKLIRWPLLNIQTHTKFRKGVTAMVNSFQEKYSWANIKKLPESYYMNPHSYPTRVVDFISKLSNLAIHVALNDPELLLMHSGEGLKPKEIIIMSEVISNARLREEELMRQNVLSLQEFEGAKNEVSNKCITLKQVNDELLLELNNLKAYAHSEGILTSDKKFEITDLKKLKDEKLMELENINKELLKYSNSFQALFQKLKAVKNPSSLCAKDFGCEESPPDLIQATSKTCNGLYQLFQCLISKKSTKEEEEDFYNQLKIAKKCLIEEKQSLGSLLSKMASVNLKN